MSRGLANISQATGLIYLRKGQCVILKDQVGLITQSHGTKVKVLFRDEKKARPVNPWDLFVTDLNWPDTIHDIQGFKR